jgi:hypothetical protein
MNLDIHLRSPKTTSHFPAHPFPSLSKLTKHHRPRNPRDAHNFDLRHSDSDTHQELYQRTRYLRKHFSNPMLRTIGLLMHEDSQVRYCYQVHLL